MLAAQLKTNRSIGLSALSLLLVLASALAVVYSSFQSRQHFSALQQEHRKTERLEEEWGRLLLEQSTWASHDRVERLATTKLAMVPPQAHSMVLLEVDTGAGK